MRRTVFYWFCICMFNEHMFNKQVFSHKVQFTNMYLEKIHITDIFQQWLVISRFRLMCKRQTIYYCYPGPLLSK